MSFLLDSLVNGNFSQQVLHNCTEACSQVCCMEPQRESYCIGESARADFAAKTDACARGALLLAAVPCGCVAIREGVRTITAKNWGERAGHFAKAVGWAAVGSGAAWLATTAPFLGGSVDQYGIACQGPKAR